MGSGATVVFLTVTFTVTGAPAGRVVPADVGSAGDAETSTPSNETTPRKFCRIS